MLPFTALETEPVKGQWFHISDTHVQAVSASKVLSSQAYLLFYERLLWLVWEALLYVQPSSSGLKEDRDLQIMLLNAGVTVYDRRNVLRAP